MADSEDGPKDFPRLSPNRVTQAILVLVIVLPTSVPHTSAVLRVCITGTVNIPAVYTSDDGYRLIDVIEATEQDDFAAMNLGARIRAQNHWHVPILREESRRPTTLSGHLSNRTDLDSGEMGLRGTTLWPG